MTRLWSLSPLSKSVTLLIALGWAIPGSCQQVQLVNAIPAMYSNEAHSDSEPGLAVDPSNLSQMVLTAFTPCPPLISTTNAPIYYSVDGGNTWQLNCILPGNNPTFGTGDVTTRFATSGGVLYAGDLRGGAGLTLNILRTNDFTSATPMTLLVTRSCEDQPYTQAMTAAGTDHVYIGNNNLADSKLFPCGGVTGQSASIDWSLDAATAPPPAGFQTLVLNGRTTCGQDLPSVRPAIHSSGKIYVAYFRNEPASPCFAGTNTVDIVVACDNNWGSDSYADCKDPGDGLAGVLAVTGLTMSWKGNLGTERIGSQLTIAVDPNNAKTVYIAWGDGTDPSKFTLHVRKSSDNGIHWDATDSLTITPATNPALAINSNGIVGFLYQKLVSPGTCKTGGAPAACWETHLQTFDGTAWTDLPQPLANVADNAGSFPLGDYDHVLSIGKDFYGAFSANNYPDTSNFYPGVQYQRYVDWGAHQLYADGGHTIKVSSSIDPFFFKVTPIDPTTLKYQGDTSADFHDPANLAAILTDKASGQPVANASVQFTLGSQTCTATTNAAGVASCTLVLTQCAGSFTVTATFAGSTLYLPSSDSKPFTINLEETTLSYTGDTVIANGGTATLSGVLLEDNTTPIAGRTVLFTLGSGSSAQTCSAVTNASGIAVCTISPVAQPLGPGVVTDTFAGDTCYRPASASGKTFLFAFLASGAFVVGDQSAQMGAKVTFWGAKWSKVNKLSGGPAPASFKGFAAAPSAEPPKCGITWTTAPGASSNPPATVPTYMGVLVSSKVVKSGSTISGDVKSIVVVKTAPGYSPNPGHPGTGTIVAEFCHQ